MLGLSGVSVPFLHPKLTGRHAEWQLRAMIVCR